MQRNLRWTALLFVLALVVAACGGGEGADTTAAGEGAVTTAAGGEGAATTAAGGEAAETTAAGGEAAETTAAGGEAADLAGVELNVMGWSSSPAEDEALTGLLGPVQPGDRRQRRVQPFTQLRPRSPGSTGRRTAT